MKRIRFHSCFSFPPKRWRDKGWFRIHNGAVCWVVLTDGEDPCYNIERVVKRCERRWPDENLDEENPLFVCVSASGAEYNVDASRVFATKWEAQVEATNLNLFNAQRAARTLEERRLHNMGKIWPHEEVREPGSLLPETLLTVKIVDGEETESKNGKYCIMFNTRVVEPKKYKNSPYRVAFYIGTDGDPEADERETWTSSFAASRYKSFLKASDAPETGDVEEEIEAATGSMLVVDNGHSQDGKYNEARAFYRSGEREEDEAPARKPSKPSKPVKPAKPTRKPVEETEEADDAWEEE